MENEDIIDFLFNMQEDEDTFNLKDHLLDELNNKIENYNDKISLIINKKSGFAKCAKCFALLHESR